MAPLDSPTPAKATVPADAGTTVIDTTGTKAAVADNAIPVAGADHIHPTATAPDHPPAELSNWTWTLDEFRKAGDAMKGVVTGAANTALDLLSGNPGGVINDIADGYKNNKYLDSVFGSPISDIFAAVGAGSKPTGGGGGGDQTAADTKGVKATVDGQGRRTVTDASGDGRSDTIGPDGKDHYQDKRTGADVVYDHKDKSATVKDIAGTGITEQATEQGTWKTLPDGRQVFTSTGNSTDFDKTKIVEGKLYVFKDGVVETKKGDNLYTYHKNGQAEIDTPQGQIQIKDGKVTYKGQTVSEENLDRIQDELGSHDLIHRDAATGAITIDRSAPAGMHVDNAQPDAVKVHIEKATVKGEAADITVKPADTPPGAAQPTPATVTFDVPNEFRTQTTFPPEGSQQQPDERAIDLRSGQPQQLFDYNLGNGDMTVGGGPNGANPDISFTPTDTQTSWDGDDYQFNNNGDLSGAYDSQNNPIEIAATVEDVQEVTADAQVAQTVVGAALSQLAVTADPNAGAAALAQLDASQSAIAGETDAPTSVIDYGLQAVSSARDTVNAAMNLAQQKQSGVLAFNAPDDPSIVLSISQSSAA